MRLVLDPNDRIAFWFPVILPILMGLIFAFAELAADLSATAIAMEHGEERNIARLVGRDLSKLWLSSVTGVASSVFAIDIWALTLLFASRTTGREGTSYAYPIVGIFVHFFLLSIVVGVSYLGRTFDAMGVVAEQTVKAATVARDSALQAEAVAKEAMDAAETASAGANTIDGLSPDALETLVRAAQASNEAANANVAAERAAVMAESADAKGERRWATGMHVCATIAALLSILVGWAVRRGIWIHHEGVAEAAKSG